MNISGRAHATAVILATGALLAGCSSSHSAKSAKVTAPVTEPGGASSATTEGAAAATTTTPSTPTTAPVTGPAAKVAGDVLRQSDLPAGWQGTPHQALASGADPETVKFFTCLGLPASAAGSSDSPSADSPDFAIAIAGGEQSVANSISVGQSPATEQQQMVALTGAKGPACISQLLAASLNSQLAGLKGGAKLAPLNTTPADLGKYLDKTVAFHSSTGITVTGPAGPQSVPTLVDLVFFERGRYTAEFIFTGVGQAPSPTLEKQALSAVAARMRSLPAT